MRFAFGILLFFSSLFVCKDLYAQTFNKPILINGYNTFSGSLCLKNDKINVFWETGDSSSPFPNSIANSFAQFDKSGHLLFSNKIRPAELKQFVSPFSYSKSYILEDGFIMGGYACDTFGNEYALLTKYDTSGSIVFSRRNIHYNTPRTYDVKLLGSKNGYILTGEMHQRGMNAFYIKADSLGNTVNQFIYTDIYPAGYVEGRGIIELDSGHAIIMAGALQEFWSPGQHHREAHKTIFLEVDSDGTEKWRAINPSIDLGVPYGFQKARDGGYISCGDYISYRDSGVNDYFIAQACIAKWDSNFNLVWTKRFYESTPKGSGGIMYDVMELADGSIIGCGAGGRTFPDGSVTSGGLIVKVDKNGNELWSKYYRTSEFPNSDEEHILFDLDVFSDGSIVAVGEINLVPNGVVPQQGWLIKVDSDGCVVDSNFCGLSSIEATVSEPADITVYPNPTNAAFNLSIGSSDENGVFILRDLFGRLLIQKEVSTGTWGFEANGLASGIYIWEYAEKNQIRKTGRLVISQ